MDEFLFKHQTRCGMCTGFTRDWNSRPGVVTDPAGKVMHPGKSSFDLHFVPLGTILTQSGHVSGPWSIALGAATGILGDVGSDSGHRKLDMSG